MTNDPQCEGCGKRPEVYGSSWCGDCHGFLPEFVKRRLLKLRNACLEARYARTRAKVNEILDAALQRS